MINYDVYEKFFIGIIKDAMSGEKNTEMPDNIDTYALTEFIKVHKMSSLLYPYLKERGIVSEELYKDFNFWLAVDAHQQFYLEKIRERFEEAKIRFVCIKGAYLKTLYPEPYMRSSGDIDIFADDETADKVRDIMLELGFTVEQFSDEMQDGVYNLGNYVHIEISRKLISNKCPWDEKCQEIIDRIVPKKEGSYEYVMTAEDFYLHMIGHMAKHFKYSGFGIRMVLDVWVYLNKFGSIIDRNILDKRLKECGLYTFEQEVKKLADYWFGGKEPGERTKELAEYIFESGLFGHQGQVLATQMAENMGENGNKKIGTAKNALKSLFLSYENMCHIYPILKKISVLLPFCWVVRAIDTIIFKRNKIKRKITAYEEIGIDYAKKTAKLKESLGL